MNQHECEWIDREMHGMQRPTTKVAQKVNVEVVKRETSLLTQCAGICTVAVLDTLTDVLANSSDYNSEDVKAREEKKKKRSVSRNGLILKPFSLTQPPNYPLPVNALQSILGTHQHHGLGSQLPLRGR